MKNLVRTLLFAIILSASFCAFTKSSTAQVSVSFQVFYDELSPHGTWINNSYGYVWIPNVTPDFAPYSTNGYWLLTDDGWTWVSNYSWGWAPFHYGRWYTDPFYGPMWIPGNEWGPGWVTWRTSGDYYGWAPIGPGISISVAYSNGYNVPSSQWTFVNNNNFGNTNISNYYVSSSNNVTIINNSTVINNTNGNHHRGPERSDVEKHTGRSYTPVHVKESNQPGQTVGNDLQIYKPRMQKDNANGQKAAPSHVSNIKDVKPAQKRSESQGQKTDQPGKQQPANQQKQQPERQQPKQQQQKEQPRQQQQQQPRQQQPKQQQQKEQPRQQQQEQPRQQQQQQQPKQQQPKQQQPRQQQQQQQPKNEQPSNQQQNNGQEKHPH
jgi:hypothetical protein